MLLDTGRVSDSRRAMPWASGEGAASPNTADECVPSFKAVRRLETRFWSSSGEVACVSWAEHRFCAASMMWLSCLGVCVSGFWEPEACDGAVDSVWELVAEGVRVDRLP